MPDVLLCRFQLMQLTCVQVCLLGGAAHSGPACDTWRLQLSLGDGGTAVGAWRAGQPLEAGRSWHTATPLPAAEVCIVD